MLLTDEPEKVRKADFVIWIELPGFGCSFFIWQDSFCMFLQNSSSDALWCKSVNLLFLWIAGKECNDPDSTFYYYSANPEQCSESQSNSLRTDAL